MTKGNQLYVPAAVLTEWRASWVPDDLMPETLSLTLPRYQVDALTAMATDERSEGDPRDEIAAILHDLYVEGERTIASDERRYRSEWSKGGAS